MSVPLGPSPLYIVHAARTYRERSVVGFSPFRYFSRGTIPLRFGVYLVAAAVHNEKGGETIN
ncbi:hypothetical protein [Pasteuria penetrans]|uniref:hypothetical protein n=1 Tax=Pasteuria penetrans TaxID=86005 RepID=UPI0011EFB00C|nr:hypothetical protein [Pasteuria penetrans]